MSISWEIVSGICAVVGVLMYFYQYKYVPYMELKNSKNNLYVLYGTSRTLVDTLIKELKQYAEDNGTYSIYFQQTITFGGYIQHLEHLRDTELSNEMLQKLKSIPLTKEYVATMTHNLNNQILSFNNIQAHFNTAFKYA